MARPMPNRPPFSFVRPRSPGAVGEISWHLRDEGRYGLASEEGHPLTRIPNTSRPRNLYKKPIQRIILETYLTKTTISVSRFPDNDDAPFKMHWKS